MRMLIITVPERQQRPRLALRLLSIGRLSWSTPGVFQMRECWQRIRCRLLHSIRTLTARCCGSGLKRRGVQWLLIP